MGLKRAFIVVPAAVFEIPQNRTLRRLDQYLSRLLGYQPKIL